MEKTILLNTFNIKYDGNVLHTLPSCNHIFFTYLEFILDWFFFPTHILPARHHILSIKLE